MGEVRRRRLALEGSPCLCGSKRPAIECCLAWKPFAQWYKSPAQLGLKIAYPGTSTERCYMSELRSCEGGISGEHFVSESVIDILADNGEFKVGGMPWLEKGQMKAIGVKSLTANCLCRRHNSALSPLDDAAARFFGFMKTCFADIDEPVTFLVSGHDIERWLLKCLMALSVSGNLSKDDKVLDGKFYQNFSVLDMLDDIHAWPDGAGLYCVMTPGEISANYHQIQIAPMGNESDEITGLWTNMFGVSFILMLQGFDITTAPELSRSQSR